MKKITCTARFRKKIESKGFFLLQAKIETRAAICACVFSCHTCSNSNNLFNVENPLWPVGQFADLKHIFIKNRLKGCTQLRSP